MKTSVIIPAHNEELSIHRVLNDLPKEWVSEVIVVNNGSTDGTARIAQKNGATVVDEPRKGYGYSILKGIQNVSNDTDIVVVLDGDYSDYPQDLPRILSPIYNNEAEFVLGSRTMGLADNNALGWNQRFGNALACFMIKVLFKKKYTDMGPFRAILKTRLDKLQLKDQTYGWNAEMQVKAIIHGLKAVEVPVRYRKRIGKSKISGTVKGTISAGYNIVTTIIRYYLLYRFLPLIQNTLSQLR